jgi:hypothetical protein
MSRSAKLHFWRRALLWLDVKGECLIELSISVKRKVTVPRGNSDMLGL